LLSHIQLQVVANDTGQIHGCIFVGEVSPCNRPKLCPKILWRTGFNGGSREFSLAALYMHNQPPVVVG